MNAKWWRQLRIGVYWSARAVPPWEAADLIRAFGARLAASDPQFGNLYGLRAAGVALLNQQLDKGEPTEQEAAQLFAQLDALSFRLNDIDTNDLATELVARAAPENPGRVSLEFNARPGGVRYCVSVGETNPALGPMANAVYVEIPFANPHSTDTELLSRLFDAAIDFWRPQTGGIYSVWHNVSQNYEARTVYWAHWRAAGVTSGTATANAPAISSGEPDGTPDTSYPHLGGTLDLYERHHPKHMAKWAVEEMAPN